MCVHHLFPAQGFSFASGIRLECSCCPWPNWIKIWREIDKVKYVELAQHLDLSTNKFGQGCAYWLKQVSSKYEWNRMSIVQVVQSAKYGQGQNSTLLEWSNSEVYQHQIQVIPHSKWSTQAVGNMGLKGLCQWGFQAPDNWAAPPTQHGMRSANSALEEPVARRLL